MNISCNFSLSDFFLEIGLFRFCWGTPQKKWEIPGYVSFAWNETQLEIGEVDQGAPGIYLVRCTEGDCQTFKTLLQFNRTSQEPFQ